MKGNTFFFILAALVVGSVGAFGQAEGWRSEQRAREVARAFLLGQPSAMAQPAASESDVWRIDTRLGEETPCLYSDGVGRFVVVSPGASPTVVGYGAAGPSDGLPGAMAALLAGRPDKSVPRTARPVAPLLRSERSQYAPFNNRAPYYTDGKGQTSATRCVAGCVATSLEQIMSYWAYPDALQDTLWGWRTANYAVDTIPKGTKIDFSNILPRYVAGEYSAAQAQAVADLVYYCGVAARMNWGVSSSGANVANLVEPMRRAFGYGGVKHLYRGLYDPEHWHRLVQEELEAGRPVFFAGYTTLMQGHAFVIDGVDERGFYHIDWGYGGKYNGYFDMDVFNTFEDVGTPTPVGRVTGHYCNQEALFLCPDAVDWPSGDTIDIHHLIEAVDVQFSRQPDCNYYVGTKAVVYNSSSYPINATLALLSYQPSERDTLMDMECVALLGDNLAPGVTAELQGYATFKRPGRRVVALADDDMNLLWADTLVVGSCSHKGVLVEQAELAQLAGDSATFRVTIQNASATAWAGNLVTYSLFLGDYTPDEGDTRQWTFLNLAPGERVTETVTFGGLAPQADYTFVVRNPWLPAAQIAFRTGATGVGDVLKQPDSDAGFDLLGRRKTGSPGWFIRGGKVYYHK